MTDEAMNTEAPPNLNWYLRHGATCALQAVRDNHPADPLCTCGLREAYRAVLSAPAGLDVADGRPRRPLPLTGADPMTDDAMPPKMQNLHDLAGNRMIPDDAVMKNVTVGELRAALSTTAAPRGHSPTRVSDASWPHIPTPPTPTAGLDVEQCGLCDGIGRVRWTGRGYVPAAREDPDLIARSEAAQLAADVARAVEPKREAILAFAKALLSEPTACLDCDRDHSWDDHMLAIWRDATDVTLVRSGQKEPEGLRKAASDVDSAWHDEGDHVEYHEELAERLFALRAALSDATAAPSGRCSDCGHEWRDHMERGCEARYPALLPLDDEGTCSCEAATPPTPTAGLDVERLAKAMVLVGLHHDASRPDWTRIAENVAAEYAALARSGQKERDGA